MISIVADLVIVAICIFILIRGIKAGFIKSFMRLLRGVVAFIAAYAFTPTLGALINSRFILPAMSKGIGDTIRSLVEKTDGVQAVTDLFSQAPDAVTQILSRYGVSTGIVNEAIVSMPSKEAAVNGAAEAIAGPVSTMISNSIAFTLIFASVFILLAIVTVILDSVFHLPVLNTANRIFGAVFAVAEAFLLAYVLSNLAGAGFRAFAAFNPEMFGQKVIDRSYVMRFFAEHDFLNMIVNVIRG